MQKGGNPAQNFDEGDVGAHLEGEPNEGAVPRIGTLPAVRAVTGGSAGAPANATYFLRSGDGLPKAPGNFLPP